MSAPSSSQRLHKHLANLGIASRRTIEGWILDGKITVDGKVAQLGDKVNSRSRITVAGRPLPAADTVATQPRVILYHKPEGEISTRNDPAGRPTVYRRLPELKTGRWVAVGRLDINTRGLLLFTNHGELANRLMHPSFGIEREYLCRVYGNVGDAAINKLKQGIMLDRQPARFTRIKRQPGDGDGKNSWYSVVVTQGKYREVRRLWAAVGCRVNRLIRIRYGEIKLPKDLQPGHWQELKPAAITKLLAATENMVANE